MRKLPALSIWRPWPALMFHGGKDVENRVWDITYRGDLLIAAAIGVSDTAIKFARHIARQPGGPYINFDAFPADPHLHPLGIVGVAEIYDVCKAALASPAKPCDCSPWAHPNEMHWKLRNIREFPTPIPHAGRQRLWAVNEWIWPDVEKQLQEVGRA